MGPRNNGPKAKGICEHEFYNLLGNVYRPYAATKTEVISAMTEVFVIPNCCAICVLAGAIIEEDTGLMKVNAETINVAAHFCL